MLQSLWTAQAEKEVSGKLNDTLNLINVGRWCFWRLLVCTSISPQKNIQSLVDYDNIHLAFIISIRRYIYSMSYSAASSS